MMCVSLKSGWNNYPSLVLASHSDQHFHLIVKTSLISKVHEPVSFSQYQAVSTNENT